MLILHGGVIDVRWFAASECRCADAWVYVTEYRRSGVGLARCSTGQTATSDGSRRFVRSRWAGARAGCDQCHRCARVCPFDDGWLRRSRRGHLRCDRIQSSAALDRWCQLSRCALLAVRESRRGRADHDRGTVADGSQRGHPRRTLRRRGTPGPLAGSGFPRQACRADRGRHSQRRCSPHYDNRACGS